jgi:hypothetical protein
MLVRAAEQESTTALTPSLIVAFCVHYAGGQDPHFKKVLTTNRVVSSDWVTHQHCPKIAWAKQFFTIT